MNLQEAIDAPAWHSEHFPASFWPRQARPGVMVVESRVPEATIKELRARGHEVEVGPAWSEGRLTAASRVGRAPPRRRQSARHAGLRRRALSSCFFGRFRHPRKPCISAQGVASCSFSPPPKPPAISASKSARSTKWWRRAPCPAPRSPDAGCFPRPNSTIGWRRASPVRPAWRGPNRRRSSPAATIRCSNGRCAKAAAGWPRWRSAARRASRVSSPAKRWRRPCICMRSRMRRLTPMSRLCANAETCRTR